MDQTEQQDAVIYARYSSHAQRDVSIEQQTKECELYAKRHGLRILGTYEDHALSGTSDKRPGFQRMIHDAAHAPWNYVIVYSLDRFARDRYDSAVYKRQLKNNGIKVLSAMENISDDPTGVLMESLLEGLAEYYSKELGAKVRRGMTDNAQKCMVNGYLPLGYVKGADGRYAIQEDEASVVHEIYTRVSRDDRICDIIEDLNRRGIKTKKGKAWNKSSFNRILSNIRYTGVYIYGDTKIPGGIPAIVSQELFDQVQYAVTSKPNPRSLGPQRRRRDNSLYMLTGKLFCGHCREPMVGICGTAKSGRIYHYYTCRGKLHHACTMRNIPRDEIEAMVAQALKEAILTDEAICALADASVAWQKSQLQYSDVGPLQAQLEDVERSINNLIRAIEMGIFTPSTQARLVELENQQRILSGQLASAQAAAAEIPTREEIIALLKIYQNGDITDKEYQQALIDAFLVAIYVYDDHLKFVFRLNKDQQVSTLPVDVESFVSNPDTSCISSAEGDQTVVYEPLGLRVVMIRGLFVFSHHR